MSFSRSAQEKSCDGFVPQETDFKRPALVLSSATTCKKIGVGLVPQDGVSKNADGPDLPVIFHDPQAQQRQASPCSHSPQRGG